MLDNKADSRDFALLENDRYTFEVLSRVLRGECRLVLTDHERLIICHSTDPYPVWIWTPDGLSEEEKAFARETVRDCCPVTEYSYNLKYELAEYFAEKAAADGVGAGITLNMFAYDCPAPVKPAETPDGCAVRCGPEDTGDAVKMLKGMFDELGLYPGCDESFIRAKAGEFVGEGRLYLWKNAAGETVASCGCHIGEDGLGSINAVFTAPEHRRKHYAENLVYVVTEAVRQEGAMPMLYTNADYKASNACYEKLGYVLRGKLCTFGMLK